MNLTAKDIKSGARYDHNYLALPAVITGKCLLVAPEIIVSDLVRTGALHVIPGSRTSSGMQYRAYAVDRSDNLEVARAFCRWVARLCKKAFCWSAASVTAPSDQVMRTWLPRALSPQAEAIGSLNPLKPAGIEPA